MNVAFPSYIVDVYDIRMAHACSVLRFSSETLDELLVPYEFRLEDFDRYKSIEKSVLGLVDHRHASFSYSLEQFISVCEYFAHNFLRSKYVNGI